MEKDSRILAGCCVTMIVALLVVGAVSHGVLRHVVQTSPLWITTVLGMRHSAWTKWAALPCFIFWLLLMTAIWLFPLGWAKILSGTFSPTEIGMTLIVGLASIVGIATAVGMPSSLRAWSAIATTLMVAVLQVTAFRLSLLSEIAHR